MFKKLSVLLTIIIFMLALYTPSFAEGTGILSYINEKNDEEFLVTITRPEGDDSTFKKSYVICGNTKLEGIKVELGIWNEAKGSFEEFQNTDGESLWEIGPSGIFMKEVILPKEGANKIRIAAYMKSEVDKLERGKNLQIDDYTITVLNESFKDKIKNGVTQVTELLKNVFPELKK